ncbi:phd finger protein 12 [Echinococcus multilocularis]|uniref:Phd finger protein 12 n=1 Tax=Echinococcus multilocularis TaxID=6211 RepID=A0A068Y6Z9_ECHMU|nr:phd finger protein 12 [Echinococcus multilocularis]
MALSDHDAQRRDSMMTQLQELFAPPTAESLGKKGLVGIPSARRSKKHEVVHTNEVSASSVARISCKDDPIWRKPRPNCHDYCDSCNCSEGDRLVCDRCPASFHLECLDPPLDSHEAPTGLWYCHRCTMLSRVSSFYDEEESSSSSSCQSSGVASSGGASSGRATIKQAEDANGIAQRRLAAVVPRTVLTGPSGRTNATAAEVVGWLTTGRRTAALKSSPLSLLWDVLKYARFLNPKEFELPKDLMPGIKIPGSYKTLAERKANPIIELENGQIPRPIRRCYNCARTCFHAPLLPCDYCTACFHLECLDPPLAQFPPRSDRWMCPVHAEHTVDKCLVRSIRLSERIRAWNQLTVFNPNLSLKASAKKTDDVFDGASHTIQYGPEDERAVLSAFLHNVRRRRLEAYAAQEIIGTLTPKLSALRSLSPAPIVVPSSVKALYENPVRRLLRLEERSRSKCQLDSSLPPHEDKLQDSRASECDRKLFIRSLLEFYLRESAQSCAKTSLDRGTGLKTCDSSVASSLTPLSTASHPPVDEAQETNVSLADKIKDVLSELDSGVSIKAGEVPAKLMECECHLSSALLNHPVSPRRFGDVPDVARPIPCLPGRAVLIACGGTTGPSVPMSYRQLVIGSAPDCHLCLANYQSSDKVQCPNVSPLHATVFYDEWSRQFELLNYSEFGSRVDSIPFENDISDKAAYRCETSGLVKHVRNIVESGKNGSSSSHNLLRMIARNRPDYNHSCIGQEKDATGAGWEGSAILHHGSVLQFGCYSFTFSLVDCLKPPSEDDGADSTGHNIPVVVEHGGDGKDTDVLMKEADKMH